MYCMITDYKAQGFLSQSVFMFRQLVLKRNNKIRWLQTHTYISRHKLCWRPATTRVERTAFEGYAELLQSITEEFKLVNLDGYTNAEQDNSKSATCVEILENRLTVEDEIVNEITEGHYLVVSENPMLVSAPRAIVRKNGSITPKPEDKSLNSYAILETKQYFTIHVELLLKQGCFMAT